MIGPPRVPLPPMTMKTRYSTDCQKVNPGADKMKVVSVEGPYDPGEERVEGKGKDLIPMMSIPVHWAKRSDSRMAVQALPIREWVIR